MNKEKATSLEVDGSIFGSYSAEEIEEMFFSFLEENELQFIGFTNELE